MILQALVTIIMIVGMLNFAQEAPDLIKNLFKGSGMIGEMISKMNPRGAFRKDAKPLVKGFGAAVGGLGGLVGGFARGAKNAGADFEANKGKSKLGRGLHTVGAALGGGARGLVSGGRAGFKNQQSMRDTFGSVMAGTSAGTASAQNASNRYRQGGSPWLFKRVGNRSTESAKNTWESVKGSAKSWGRAVAGNRTAEAASAMYDTASNNYKDAMSVTGTDKDIENLKSSRDKALDDLRKQYLKGDIKAEVDSSGSIIKTAEQVYKDKIDAVKATFKTQKADILSNKFNELSDDTRDIIAKYNEQTLSSFQENAAMLGHDDLEKVLNEVAKTGVLTGFSVDPADLTGSLKEAMEKMGTLNTADNLKTQGADIMKIMESLEDSLKTVNDNIASREKFEEHERARRRRNNSTSGSTSGDSGSGSGGGSK